VATGDIHAPGGKVVVVHNNFGRIVVGDPWPKLIVRAAITGLVAGLVLLFGKWAAAATLAGGGALLVWLFKKQRPHEVVSAGGSAAMRALVAGAALVAVTAAPAAVKVTAIDRAPTPIAIDAGAPDAIVRDAGRPDANLDAIDPYIYVMRLPEAPGDGCKALIAANKPAPPIALSFCPEPGSRQLYAGYDTVVVGVVLAPTELGTEDLGPFQPQLELRSNGARYASMPFERQPAASGVLHLVSAFHAEAAPSAELRMIVHLGDRSFDVGVTLQSIAYPEPFWLAVRECLVQAGAQRETRRANAPCVLSVRDVQGAVTLDADLMQGNPEGTVTQALARNTTRFAPIRYVGPTPLKTPAIQGDALWLVTLTLDDGRTRTVRVQLRP